MDYLLDSNVCIIYMNGRSLELKQRLESHHRKNIYVCSVVKAELYYGAMQTRNPYVTSIHSHCITH
jgi:tRNA(fMet)-specific endonuclease VapC